MSFHFVLRLDNNTNVQHSITLRCMIHDYSFSAFPLAIHSFTCWSLFSCSSGVNFFSGGTLRPSLRAGRSRIRSSQALKWGNWSMDSIPMEDQFLHLIVLKKSAGYADWK